MDNYLQKSKAYKGFHYSVLSDDMYTYLHNTTKKMFREIIDIFNEYNIRYTICGGTLLGAYTRGKFIPWDDDVDICVWEEDYERMISVLLDNLSDNWKLQCTKTEPNYFHGWVKVRDKNSVTYPKNDSYNYNGVWIDLYKIIKCDTNEVDYLIAKEHLDYLQRRFVVGSISNSEKNKRINDNQLLERIKVSKEKFNEKTGRMVYVIWSASKIVLEESWYQPFKKYFFEGIECFSFYNAEKYLISHYGSDFKKLPPDDMRRVGINRITY